MSSFLFTAKDQFDTLITERVDAENLEAAQHILQKRGLTDIRFFEDTMKSKINDMWAKENIEIPSTSPEFDLQTFQTRHVYLHIFRNNLPTIVCLLGSVLWNVYSLYAHPQFRFLDYVGFLCTGVLLLLCGYTVLPLYFYTAILTHQVYKRWKKAFRLIDFILSSKPLFRWPLPIVELVMLKGQCYAEMGQLSQALTLLEKYDVSSVLERQFYLQRLASLYLLAGDIETGIRLNLEACDLSEMDGSAYINLAFLYIHYKASTDQCRHYLHLAEPYPLTELARAYRFRCLGLLHFYEQNYVKALSDLHTAISMYQQFPSNPSLIESVYETYRHVLSCHVYLHHQEPARRVFHILSKYYKRSSQYQRLAEIETEVQSMGG